MIALLARILGPKVVGLIFSKTGAVIVAIGVVLGGVHWFTVHERSVGRAEIVVAVAKANAKAAAIATTLAQERDAAVARASIAETARAALVAAVAGSTRDAIKGDFAHAPAAAHVVCLDASILRAIRDGDAAAARAAGPARAGARPLRYPAARVGR